MDPEPRTLSGAKSLMTAAVYGDDLPPRWFVERLDDVIAAARSPEPWLLREAAQRLCDTYADVAAIRGLGLGWKAEMDADDALLCALQDTRTALDGRERPHVHKALKEG